MIVIFSTEIMLLRSLLAPAPIRCHFASPGFLEWVGYDNYVIVKKILLGHYFGILIS